MFTGFTDENEFLMPRATWTQEREHLRRQSLEGYHLTYSAQKFSGNWGLIFTDMVLEHH